MSDSPATSTPEAGRVSTFKLRRLIRGVAWCGLGLYVVLILGDAGYAFWVRRGIALEERNWKFDASGVRADCHATTVGTGSTALLMVHGFNDSPRIWDRMARSLSERGFTCRAMRLPGFAEHHDAYARRDATDWSQAIRDEIATLRESHARVFLVGHSLGGALALRHSLDDPSSIDGTVLVAPAIDIADDRSPLLPVRTWHRIASSVLVFVPATASPFPVDVHDEQAEAYPYRTAFTPRSVIDATIALIDKNAADSSRVDVPILVAISPDDRVVDSGAIERWFEQVAAPRKERFVASRSGHAIPLDFDADDLSAAIATFARE